MVEQHNKRIESFLKLGIGIVIILIANILSDGHFFRLDLTEEKRYTISDATKDILSNLDDQVYIEVYLSGDLNSEFKRFSNSVRETLEEFRVHAGNNIQFEFVDPEKAESGKAKEEFAQRLAQKGIIPTDVFDNIDGKKVSKRIFPGAMVSYGGVDVGVMLFKGNQGQSASERLNQSIEGIEYELASGIRKTMPEDRKKIGLIKGHGELDSLDIADLTNSLLESYNVYNVDIAKRDKLNGYDAIILAQPKEAFTKEDNYKLDQFIMNGGKAIIALDMVAVNMDSVGGDGTVGIPVDLGLTDQLFKYGVRVNTDLIQDLEAGDFPVVVGMSGNQPQIRKLKWPYYVIANVYGKHAITRNLDASYAKFASTIDTVAANGIKKTGIMYSSNYSRKLQAPLVISLNSLREIKEENFMNQQSKAIAYLLEGSFTSCFKNRFLPKTINTDDFVSDGIDSKILVIGDGDFVKNDFNYRKKEPFPLGFDPVTGSSYGNRDLIMNALEYMLNENGIIAARNKEIKIRPLDKIKVKEDRIKWQIICLVFPIVFIVLFGIIRQIIRKKKYTGFKKHA